VVTEAEARAFRRAFFEEFPELQRWHARQRSLARKYKRVESPLGRVRHLPDIDSPVDGVRAEAERQAINSPVQATASDMCLYSLVLISKEFERFGLKARSVGTVHDAINFEVPVAEVPTVLPLIRRTMENLPLDRFGCFMDVPIIADAKIGTRWGSAIEVPEKVSSSPVALDDWLREHAGELGLGLAA
jgi:DNA polymerase-1